MLRVDDNYPTEEKSGLSNVSFLHSDINMNLIIIHDNGMSSHQRDDRFIRFGLTQEPVSGLICDVLCRSSILKDDRDSVVTIPQSWVSDATVRSPKAASYDGVVTLSSAVLTKAKKKPFFTISNGRFVADSDAKLIEKVIKNTDADVLSVNVKPGLVVNREKVCMTSQGNVAGFRRLL